MLSCGDSLASTSWALRRETVGPVRRTPQGGEESEDSRDTRHGPRRSRVGGILVVVARRGCCSLATIKTHGGWLRAGGRDVWRSRGFSLPLSWVQESSMGNEHGAVSLFLPERARLQAVTATGAVRSWSPCHD